MTPLIISGHHTGTRQQHSRAQRDELPPVSWTSKLKSREWEAFRACGCAVEA